MLSALFRSQTDDRHDALHALLLAAGAALGLILLQLYATFLNYDPTVPQAALDLIVPWQYANLKPEPWETQLYHAGAWLVPLTAVVFWLMVLPLFQRMRERVTVRRAAGLLMILAAGFLALLTIEHSSAWHDTLPTAETPLWYSLWTAHPAFLLAILLSAAAWYIPWHTVLHLSERWKTVLELLLVTLVILWLAIDPSSFLSSQIMGANDDDWFLVPSHDILLGKHLLVASQSQYGFLLHYLLAGAFSLLGGVSTVHFRLVMMVIHALYYAVIYYSLRILLPSRRDALVGALFLLGMSIMRNYIRSEPYGEPSITRLRNWLDAPFILFLALELRKPRRLWFLLSCITASIAFFYNSDMGVSLFLAATTWCIALPLFQEQRPRPLAHRVGLRLATLLLCLTTVSLILALVLKDVSGSYPQWGNYFSFTSLYLSGFGAMPMPIIGAYWLVLGAYACAILATVAALLLRRPWRTAPLILSVAGYGMLTFHYYVNRSFTANLWVVSFPAALCLFLLFVAYRDAVRSSSAQSLRHPAIRLPVSIIATILLITAVTADLVGAWNILERRYTHPPQAAAFDPAFAQSMDASVAAIQSRIPAGKRVVIISPRESLFLLNADRASAFPAPFLATVFTTPRLQAMLDRFVQERHPYVFVDHASPERCQLCAEIVKALPQWYQRQTTEGLLDVYERKP